MQRDFVELQASKVMSDEILVLTRSLQRTSISPYRRFSDPEKCFANTKSDHYALIRNFGVKFCSFMCIRNRAKSYHDMDALKGDIVRSNTL